MDETSLIHAAKQGDLEAFNQIVLKYQEDVYNHVDWMLHDPYQADDITQDAFLQAYRNLVRFRGGSLRAWLMRIATNLSLDELRRKKRRPAVSLTPVRDDGEEDDTQDRLADPGQTVEESVEQSELKVEIRQSLDQLTPEYRAVLVLIDMLDFDYVEAASALGIPVGTLKSRLARARLRLRDVLQGSMRISHPVGVPG